ncbi:Nanos-type domain-containing protein [Caenorhabditis elegans]|uniref:Nanos-type domain-containing protein n=1 Tax=Caenorhabditis elegans TaxID=6239 RepID=Q23406_CAEEL|nr:Nanos-type domain-containing protein [Caenorhabditis elegans]CCD73713.1 Nanos-type domain-containing protein [Caenorhabditis elegans]|eukprot:NP_495452.1 NanOS related [Caenorhabditis elegans]
MSLGTPSEPTSTLESDIFDDLSLYYLEDVFLSATTPSPTFDLSDPSDPSLSDSFDSEWSPMTPCSIERPETSTSSIFSFEARPIKTPPPAEYLRLPTFLSTNNSGFFDSVVASDFNLYGKFNDWLNDSKPRSGSFAIESAEELARNPRETRSEPEVPSLFKRREYGCGYCRSVGYMRWETHTRKKCDKLSSLAPCKICGARGEMNHTETYCPMKPSSQLFFNEDFSRDFENRRFQRSRYQFYKHSSLIQKIYASSEDSF